MSGRFRALVLLAFALVVTSLRRLFGRRRQAGIAAFRRNYDADRLPPVSVDERQKLSSFGRCIACGLCDRGEAARIRSAGGAYPGLMQLILSASRSMPDFTAAARGFAHVPEAVLEEKERICPTFVPFREIARFVREKAREVEQSMRPDAG